MAESTLSIQFSDLQKEVGSFLGYGVDVAKWTSDQSDEVDRYIQSGIRQFYFPPAVNGVEAGYEWSFLKPTGTVTTVADNPAVDLPDSLSRVLGDLHYPAAVHSVPVVLVSEGRYHALLQQNADKGRPTFAAVRYKTSDGSAGQRLEIVFWPTPDAVFTLTYRYESYAGKLTASKPYPLGGMRHSELITESCLAVAEQKANDEKGLHTERFMALLAAGIAQDRRMGSVNYGQMGSPECNVIARPVLPSVYPITYKGESL